MGMSRKYPWAASYAIPIPYRRARMEACKRSLLQPEWTERKNVIPIKSREEGWMSSSPGVAILPCSAGSAAGVLSTKINVHPLHSRGALSIAQLPRPRPYRRRLALSGRSRKRIKRGLAFSEAKP